jgi:hypothetical protein
VRDFFTPDRGILKRIQLLKNSGELRWQSRDIFSFFHYVGPRSRVALWTPSTSDGRQRASMSAAAFCADAKSPL